MLFLNKTIKYGLYFLIFLLPWQVRWLWQENKIQDKFWEYGSFSLYGTEILLWFLVILVLLTLLIPYFQKKKTGIQQSLPFKEYKNKFFTCLPFLIFIIYAFASILWSENKFLSLYYSFHILEAFILGWLIVKVGSLHRKPRVVANSANSLNSGLLLALVLSGVVQSVLVFWQFLTQEVIASKWLGMSLQIPASQGAAVIETSLRRYLRAYGSLPHPNILAGFLVITLAATVILYVLIYKRLYDNDSLHQDEYFNRDNFGRFKSPLISKLVKIINNRYALLLFSIGLLTAYTAELAALVLTFSRSAWLAVTVSVILMSLIWLIRLKKNREKFSFLQWPLFFKFAFISAVVLISLGIIFKEPLSVRGKALVANDIKKTERLENKSYQERIEGINESLSLIKINPFLGWGVGSYTEIVHQLLDSGRPSWRLQPAHNIYLLILSELGIAGLLLFFWLIKELLLHKTRFYKNLVLSFGFVSIFLIIGLFDHYLWSLYFGVMLWGLVGGMIWVCKE